MFRECCESIHTIAKELAAIRRILHGALIHREVILLAIRTTRGETFMPVTLEVGKTATAVAHRFKGTTEIPLLGAPVYSSSDASVASVDPATGVITAVAEGTVTITGTDTDGLAGSDTVTDTITQTITLTITPN